jgi:hypothetical protein
MKDIIKLITTKPYIFISIPISFLLFLFILLIDMRFGLLIDFSKYNYVYDIKNLKLNDFVIILLELIIIYILITFIMYIKYKKEHINYYVAEYKNLIKAVKKMSFDELLSITMFFYQDSNTFSKNTERVINDYRFLEKHIKHTIEEEFENLKNKKILNYEIEYGKLRGLLDVDAQNYLNKELYNKKIEIIKDRVNGTIKFKKGFNEKTYSFKES